MVFVAFQIILATVFGVSATSKLLSFSAFKNSLHNFFGKIRYEQSIAIAVVTAELITAVAIAFLNSNEAGLWNALFLLAAFTGLIISNLTRGRTFPCSCFGNTSSNPISWWDVGRNFVFSLIAIYLLVARDKDINYPLEPILTLVLVALLTLGWFIGIKFILRLKPSSTRSNPQVELSNAIGKKLFPSVIMPDGSTLSIDTFILRGKPVALFILDFQFASCLRVFDNIHSHFNALEEVFTVVLVGKNMPTEIIEMSRSQAFDVVSQVDYSVSNFFGVTGVPSLITLNEVGEMLSRLTGESALVTALSSSGFDSLLKPASILNENYFKKVSNSELTDLVMYDQKGRLISFSGSTENMLLVFWSPYCSACGGLLADISHLSSANDLLRIVLITPVNHKAIENFDSIVIDKDFVIGKKLSIAGTPSSILSLPGIKKPETYLAVGKENIVHLINQFQVWVSNSTLTSKIYETVN
jgi:hypothetical protein